MDPITTFLLISIIVVLDVLALRGRIVKIERKIESLIAVLEEQNIINREIDKRFNEIYTELEKNNK